MTNAPSLRAQALSLGYGDRHVVSELSLAVPVGRITVVVGANACGKSTLLRGLARVLSPRAGTVYLDGKDIHTLPSKHVATRLGLLPQSPTAPDGIRVSDLVSRGRYPHQGWFGGRSTADDEAVARALVATGTLELANRCVDELSGGQRQRVWIAMALAQETGLLLLDEPTAFLDVCHEIEVLDLLTDLNRRHGTTIVIVLHNLNLAARYADHLVAMKDGRIVAEGSPAAVITEETRRRRVRPGVAGGAGSRLGNAAGRADRAPPHRYGSPTGRHRCRREAVTGGRAPDGALPPSRVRVAGARC